MHQTGAESEFERASLVLSEKAQTLLLKRGISPLYPAQHAALNALRAGRSVLVNIPTSAGKSLIAELHLIEYLTSGRRMLYLVPLNSLLQQKRSEFETIMEMFPLKRMVVLSGELSHPGGTQALEQADFGILTFEKFDSIMSPELLGAFDCVVIDEIHVVCEPQRGPTLEFLIAKLRSLRAELRPQLLAFSGTLGDPELLSRWLGAVLIHHTKRPIELQIRTEIVPPTSIVPMLRTLQDQFLNGILMFVYTRKNAEQLAAQLGGIIGSAAERLYRSRSLEQKLQMLGPQGVAFHHAGLSMEAREQISRAYNERQLRVIVATTTLAAGINYPCDCVVIRDIRRMNETEGFYRRTPLSTREIYQMLGRAGRPGLSTEAHGIILGTSPLDKRILERYKQGVIEPETSAMSIEQLPIGILRLLDRGHAQTQHEIEEIVGALLWFRTCSIERRAVLIDEALAELSRVGFLREDDPFQTTRLGATVVRFYLPYRTATFLSSLAKLIVPASELDTRTFESLLLWALLRAPNAIVRGRAILGDQTGETLAPLLDLGPSEDRILPRLIEQIHQLDEEPPANEGAVRWTHQIVDRWIDEVSQTALEERFGCAPGDLRRILNQLEWTTVSLGEICALERGQHRTVERIRTLAVRLHHGVRTELLPLLTLRQIGRIRARRLFNAGIRTVAQFEQTDPAIRATIIRGASSEEDRSTDEPGYDG